ncbi:uncharacterized protein LOC105202148 [Solenopsis invicta]|uniref:uncharacterized protein LOC105202148 n=1 Tax=Solenopsis invicta TaxID=13686 RepID=UPI000595E677|nr:uncharacterized protein LOC105202148 [Solenopsis invicta]
MKYLYVGFMFFVYNYYIIWGQNLTFLTNEETAHVSDDNSTVTERIPIVFPNKRDRCPKGMMLYPSNNEKNESVCNCKPGYLSLNDSCHEAYRQGPCPLNNYVVLSEETVPHCVENPCLQDSMVQYNDKCYYLRMKGPCASDEILDVIENTFQLECIKSFRENGLIEINPPLIKCPPGSQRSLISGRCLHLILHKEHQAALGE